MVSYSDAARMVWWDEMFLKAHTVPGVGGLLFSSFQLFSALILGSLSLSVFQPTAVLTPPPLELQPDYIDTKTDLCSGHHKTATIFGYGQRDKTPP